MGAQNGEKQGGIELFMSLGLKIRIPETDFPIAPYGRVPWAMTSVDIKHVVAFEL